MFSCEEVLVGLSDYMDDAVAAAVRREIEEHMAHCRNCRAIYDSTRKTLRIVTESGAFELSEDVSARIASKIGATIRAKRSEPSDASGS